MIEYYSRSQAVLSEVRRVHIYKNGKISVWVDPDDFVELEERGFITDKVQLGDGIIEGCTRAGQLIITEAEPDNEIEVLQDELDTIVDKIVALGYDIVNGKVVKR